MLGIGLSVTVDEADQNTNGEVEIALSAPFGASERFLWRSSFPEVQRRSTMSAADVLHRALKNR